MKNSILSVVCLLTLASCTVRPQEPDVATKPDLTTLASGVYRAYPGPVQERLSPAPEGYEAFYISHYGRHGSRYQPSDRRYLNTLQRLQEAHDRGMLTPYGEMLLPQIQTLCDSCVGHGGLLTRLGYQQHRDIAKRMAERFPEVLGSGRFISARASVVRRCQQSMEGFFEGLHEVLPQATNHLLECDSAYMGYIAYDTPALRQLSAQDAEWRKDFDLFYREHTFQPRVVDTVFTNAEGLDTLAFVDDFYWLAIGMQNVEVPSCDLSGLFTEAELFDCYRCVNYRMYVCNANAPISQGIPAHSASTLLQNIVTSADQAIAVDTVAATLRFGHDSNLLRLMALMRVQGCVAEVNNPAEAYREWQEAVICPMGANLQLVFYRNPSKPERDQVLVKVMHNEGEVQLEGCGCEPVCGLYYRWSELRDFFLNQIQNDNSQTEFVEPVQ